ncbi:MAG TPA: ABC transporter ATP-binding protein [Thermoanaerobaculia bacterium]|nr:ABC transporter ATP-binding protein [Thermoanaerobaculia bacterium]
MSAALLELDGLTRVAGGRRLVDGLTFSVAAGELLVLVGASGSGKTTTLKMINRLVEPSAGEVRLAGRRHDAEPPHLLRRRIGYVFQQVGLFPHLTVAENVGITPALLGWERHRICARVAALLELMQLPADFAGRLPAQLSGGEQQRVGIARALAAEPPLLLLDEPFGALDPLTREALQRSFRELQRRLGLTAVFVTHDVVEAVLLADRIAVLRTGRLLQVGTPAELLQRPADPDVEALMATPRRQAEALRARLGGAG